MNQQNIKIHNEGNINAIGKHNSGHCKPVICVETGIVYSSITDAAKMAGVHYTMMNGHLRGKFKSVKGNHYRYLNDALDNPDSVFEQLRKMSATAEANAEDAQKWRAYQAELKAAAEAEAKRLEEERKAKEARLAKIEKVKKKIERRTRVVDNARNHLNNAEQRLADACAELRELEGVSEDAN